MWAQGEHVAIIGDTGSGKTYLENRLLKLRTWVIFFRTKKEQPDDDPMDRSYKRVRSVSQIDATRGYWLLDPPHERQRLEGLRLFHKARTEGSWTLALDELYGVTHDLGMEKQVNWGLTQGRSGRITMVCGTQRPAGISRWMLSQCTHACIFSLEGRDVKEVLVPSLSPRILPAIERLRWERHEFVYFNRRTKAVSIETAQSVGRVM